MLLVQVWQCPAHCVARGEGAGRCHAYRVRYDCEMGRYLVAVRSQCQPPLLKLRQLLIDLPFRLKICKKLVKIGLKLEKNMTKQADRVSIQERS